MSDLDVLHSLRRRLQTSSGRVRRRDAYYNGTQLLSALGLGLPPEIRKLQVVVHWPRLVVDSLEERLMSRGSGWPTRPTQTRGCGRW